MENLNTPPMGRAKPEMVGGSPSGSAPEQQLLLKKLMLQMQEQQRQLQQQMQQIQRLQVELAERSQNSPGESDSCRAGHTADSPQGGAGGSSTSSAPSANCVGSASSATASAFGTALPRKDASAAPRELGSAALLTDVAAARGGHRSPNLQHHALPASLPRHPGVPLRPLSRQQFVADVVAATASAAAPAALSPRHSEAASVSGPRMMSAVRLWRPPLTAPVCISFVAPASSAFEAQETTSAASSASSGRIPPMPLSASSNSSSQEIASCAPPAASCAPPAASCAPPAASCAPPAASCAPPAASCAPPTASCAPPAASCAPPAASYAPPAASRTALRDLRSDRPRSQGPSCVPPAKATDERILPRVGLAHDALQRAPSATVTGAPAVAGRTVLLSAELVRGAEGGQSLQCQSLQSSATGGLPSRALPQGTGACRAAAGGATGRSSTATPPSAAPQGCPPSGFRPSSLAGRAPLRVPRLPPGLRRRSAGPLVALRRPQQRVASRDSPAVDAEATKSESGCLERRTLPAEFGADFELVEEVLKEARACLSDSPPAAVAGRHQEEDADCDTLLQELLGGVPGSVEKEKKPRARRMTEKKEPKGRGCTKGDKKREETPELGEGREPRDRDPETRAEEGGQACRRTRRGKPAVSKTKDEAARDGQAAEAESMLHLPEVTSGPASETAKPATPGGTTALSRPSDDADEDAEEFLTFIGASPARPSCRGRAANAWRGHPYPLCPVAAPATRHRVDSRRQAVCMCRGDNGSSSPLSSLGPSYFCLPLRGPAHHGPGASRGVPRGRRGRLHDRSRSASPAVCSSRYSLPCSPLVREELSSRVSPFPPQPPCCPLGALVPSAASPSSCLSPLPISASSSGLRPGVARRGGSGTDLACAGAAPLARKGPAPVFGRCPGGHAVSSPRRENESFSPRPRGASGRGGPRDFPRRGVGRGRAWRREERRRHHASLRPQQRSRSCSPARHARDSSPSSPSSSFRFPAARDFAGSRAPAVAPTAGTDLSVSAPPLFHLSALETTSTSAGGLGAFPASTSGSPQVNEECGMEEDSKMQVLRHELRIALAASSSVKSEAACAASASLSRAPESPDKREQTINPSKLSPSRHAPSKTTKAGAPVNAFSAVPSALGSVTAAATARKAETAEQHAAATSSAAADASQSASASSPPPPPGQGAAESGCGAVEVERDRASGSTRTVVDAEKRPGAPRPKARAPAPEREPLSAPGDDAGAAQRSAGETERTSPPSRDKTPDGLRGVPTPHAAPRCASTVRCGEGRGARVRPSAGRPAAGLGPVSSEASRESRGYLLSADARLRSRGEDGLNASVRPAQKCEASRPPLAQAREEAAKRQPCAEAAPHVSPDLLAYASPSLTSLSPSRSPEAASRDSLSPSSRPAGEVQEAHVEMAKGEGNAGVRGAATEGDTRDGTRNDSPLVSTALSPCRHVPPPPEREATGSVEEEASVDGSQEFIPGEGSSPRTQEGEYRSARGVPPEASTANACTLPQSQARATLSGKAPAPADAQPRRNNQRTGERTANEAEGSDACGRASPHATGDSEAGRRSPTGSQDVKTSNKRSDARSVPAAERDTETQKRDEPVTQRERPVRAAKESSEQTVDASAAMQLYHRELMREVDSCLQAGRSVSASSAWAPPSASSAALILDSQPSATSHSAASSHLASSSSALPSSSFTSSLSSTSSSSPATPFGRDTLRAAADPDSMASATRQSLSAAPVQPLSPPQPAARAVYPLSPLAAKELAAGGAGSGGLSPSARAGTAAAEADAQGDSAGRSASATRQEDQRQEHSRNKADVDGDPEEKAAVATPSHGGERTQETGETTWGRVGRVAQGGAAEKRKGRKEEETQANGAASLEQETTTNLVNKKRKEREDGGEKARPHGKAPRSYKEADAVARELARSSEGERDRGPHSQTGAPARDATAAERTQREGCAIETEMQQGVLNVGSNVGSKSRTKRTAERSHENAESKGLRKTKMAKRDGHGRGQAGSHAAGEGPREELEAPNGAGDTKGSKSVESKRGRAVKKEGRGKRQRAPGVDCAGDGERKPQGEGERGKRDKAEAGGGRKEAGRVPVRVIEDDDSHVSGDATHEPERRGTQAHVRFQNGTAAHPPAAKEVIVIDEDSPDMPELRAEPSLPASSQRAKVRSKTGSVAHKAAAAAELAHSRDPSAVVGWSSASAKPPGTGLPGGTVPSSPVLSGSPFKRTFFPSPRVPGGFRLDVPEGEAAFCLVWGAHPAEARPGPSAPDGVPSGRPSATPGSDDAGAPASPSAPQSGSGGVCPLHGPSAGAAAAGGRRAGERRASAAAETGRDAAAERRRAEEAGPKTPGGSSCSSCLKIVSLFRQFCFARRAPDGSLQPLGLAAASSQPAPSSPTRRASSSAFPPLSSSVSVPSSTPPSPPGWSRWVFSPRQKALVRRGSLLHVHWRFASGEPKAGLGLAPLSGKGREARSERASSRAQGPEAGVAAETAPPRDPASACARTKQSGGASRKGGAESGAAEGGGGGVTVSRAAPSDSQRGNTPLGEAEEGREKPGAPESPLKLSSLVAGWSATYTCLEGHLFDRAYDELEAGRWCSVCSAAALLTSAAKRRAMRHDRHVEEKFRERQQKLIQEAHQQFAATAAVISGTPGTGGSGGSRPIPPCMARRRGVAGAVPFATAVGQGPAHATGRGGASRTEASAECFRHLFAGLDKDVQERLRMQAQEDVRLFSSSSGRRKEAAKPPGSPIVSYATQYPPTVSAAAAATAAAFAARAAGGAATVGGEGCAGAGRRDAAGAESTHGGSGEPAAACSGKTKTSKDEGTSSLHPAAREGSGGEGGEDRGSASGKALTEEQALAVRRVLACKQNSAWYILQIEQPSKETAPHVLRSQARAAFRHLALLVHPDKNPHPRAADAMRAVTGAFQQIAGKR
ncbi:hypothetical protein BESB_061970 [Besnoitia besnoiti]|uniref:DnaJ domain-containing protein n=1 Tax=Besnoitia besnoiti TaxID=94643 RepID=A0A2A9MIS9_BESBE|nr:hypothetical protein BESB_061970 [Besnoitia besnoiti]PFH35310.1 hypothetical protein BESB_061970 [Besnoitia besnoiti]